MTGQEQILLSLIRLTTQLTELYIQAQRDQQVQEEQPEDLAPQPVRQPRRRLRGRVVENLEVPQGSEVLQANPGRGFNDAIQEFNETYRQGE